MQNKAVDERVVRALIRRGEQMDVEFKSDRQRLSDDDIVETVVCVANMPPSHDSGIILIGIDDDGAITGAHPRHGHETDPGRLRAMIFNRTEPPLDTDITVVNLHEGSIVAIRVPRASDIVATKSGKTLRRVAGLRGPQCDPFYPHQFASHRSALGREDISAQPLEGCNWSDLDPLEIERARRTVVGLAGDGHLVGLGDIEFAKALGLVETRGERLVPNVAGLLLFGRQAVLNRVIPSHDVAFQVLGPSGDVLVNDSLRGPLLRTLEEIEQRFAARNTEREVIVGMIRLGIPDCAPQAFREAVNNAVLHRDYSQHKAVYIQWHPDRLFITNPGGFVSGITLDNLLVHEPAPRNPRLADAFRRIGLIERTGRGIDKIYDGQLRYGRPAPDYSESDATAVRVTMSGQGASVQFASFVFEQQRVGRILSLDELIVLDQLRREKRSNAVAAATLIQKSEPVARAVLERMVEWGVVEARGERRGRVYLLSAAIYRTLGESTAYVRSRGFDRIRQEAMILEFVKAHGEVRRVDVIELCALTPREATKLLGAMTDRGMLRRRGTDRGSHYVLGSAV